jgi:hypothetical protein
VLRFLAHVSLCFLVTGATYEMCLLGFGHIHYFVSLKFRFLVYDNWILCSWLRCLYLEWHCVGYVDSC